MFFLPLQGRIKEGYTTIMGEKHDILESIKKYNLTGHVGRLILANHPEMMGKSPEDKKIQAIAQHIAEKYPGFEGDLAKKIAKYLEPFKHEVTQTKNMYHVGGKTFTAEDLMRAAISREYAENILNTQVPNPESANVNDALKKNQKAVEDTTRKGLEERAPEGGGTKKKGGSTIPMKDTVTKPIAAVAATIFLTAAGVSMEDTPKTDSPKKNQVQQEEQAAANTVQHLQQNSAAARNAIRNTQTQP